MINLQLTAGALLINPIGHVLTPWARSRCPKNMVAARATGESATLLIDAPFRLGLEGLERASHLIVLGWFAGVDRDVLVQRPSHLNQDHGCFALRTPARPNPVGVSIVRQVSLDQAAGRITIDALDWFDGTQLLDIKPYYASTDCLPDATVREI